MLNLSKLFVSDQIKARTLFAVTKGKFVGDFYLVYEIGETEISFIALPDFQLIKLSKQKVDNALKKGILDMVRILPKDVFKHIVTEYLGRKRL